MKTTGVITSKAKPTRKETSLQAEIPASAKGRSEAAALHFSQEKDRNFTRHGELGRRKNKEETKAKVSSVITQGKLKGGSWDRKLK